MSIEGKYQLIQSENFENYLKDIGVGYLQRKVLANAKPLVTISFNSASGDYTMIYESLKTITFKFKLGQDFEEDKPDGGKYTSVVTVEDGKMIHKQKFHGKPTIVMTREFSQEGMSVLCDSGTGVFSKRFFKRV